MVETGDAMNIIKWLIGFMPKKKADNFAVFRGVFDADSRARTRRVNPDKRKKLFDAGWEFYLRGDRGGMATVVECLDYLTRGCSRRCKRRRGYKP